MTVSLVKCAPARYITVAQLLYANVLVTELVEPCKKHLDAGTRHLTSESKKKETGSPAITHSLLLGNTLACS